jgi:hypothetical protein
MKSPRAPQRSELAPMPRVALDPAAELTADVMRKHITGQTVHRSKEHFQAVYVIDARG